MPLNCRSLLPEAALALLLLGQPARAQAQPPLAPTRDVDITYEVTRPHQARIRERVRWLAAEHLERIDGPDRSVTIIDRQGDEITLLIPATRTYRKLEGTPRRPMEPEAHAVLSRGGESAVAGQRCLEWSWIEDIEARTVCVTADGVALSLVVDGKTVMEARSVSYGRQNPELFKTPPDYMPALAPEGGAAP
ncbi:MAG TPA: hypothetical protein VNU65_04160 [Xanthobacteraceae bacterium]|nr:hypothetical protein [Xanthobacteraceae bacterium]